MIPIANIVQNNPPHHHHLPNHHLSPPFPQAFISSYLLKSVQFAPHVDLSCVSINATRTVTHVSPRLWWLLLWDAVQTIGGGVCAVLTSTLVLPLLTWPTSHAALKHKSTIARHLTLGPSCIYRCSFSNEAIALF